MKSPGPGLEPYRTPALPQGDGRPVPTEGGQDCVVAVRRNFPPESLILVKFKN